MASNYKETVNQKNLEYIGNQLDQLPDWIRKYYNLHRADWSTNTMKSYIFSFRHYFDYLQETDPEHYNGHITIQSLQPVNIPAVQEYRTYLADKGLKRTSIKAHFSALVSLWDYLVTSENFENNPFAAVKIPKDRKKASPVYLHGDENIKFYDAVISGEGLSERGLSYRDAHGTGYRDYLICHVLGLTGIRVSELVGLDIGDIDFDHAIMWVVLKGVSSAKEKTKIYLNDQLLEELAYYIREERDLFEPDKTEKALFLVSQGAYKGQRLSVRSVEQIVKKYAKAAGVMDADRFSPHKLRHSYGVVALQNSGNVELVRRLLHHENISTTQIYLDSSDDLVVENNNAGQYTSKKH